MIKTAEEIVIMRQGCQILADVMDAIGQKVVVGVSGMEIDLMAEHMIREAGCQPAFKGYGAEDGDPFPGTICFSINEGIVHGIPSERVVCDGDVVKIDIGLVHKGFYADMARTFLVGAVSDEAKKLEDVTRTAFFKGFVTIKNGSTLFDFAHAVQNHAERHGFNVVKNLVGHGIGTHLHETPQIPNYVGKKSKDFTFKTGMTLALEPMVNVGTDQTIVGADGWTYETADGSLSAHYENTIVVTEKGAEILTVYHV